MLALLPLILAPLEVDVHQQAGNTENQAEKDRSLAAE
jgi:hypothetical protein